MPGLGDVTLVSIWQHSQVQGNYFHSESNQAILVFPSYLISLANLDEVGAIVMKSENEKLDFNKTNAILSNNKLSKTATLMESKTQQYIPKAKRVTC